MKKRYGFTIFRLILLFLFGFCIYIYPFVADRWNAYVDKQMIEDYKQVVIDNGPEERYEAMFDASDQYNASLYAEMDQIVFDNHENEQYEKLMNLKGNGIMGYIDIPKIQINVPVYHYTTDDVLEKGIGHVSGSSLPVGGEKTRCILTGHRGMPEAKMFTDLDRVKEGDRFYIHILNRDLAYEVFDIQTVLPYELDSLKFEDGKDLVTLVTCTPYGVNTHRLLVTGRRVEYDPEIKSEEEENGRTEMMKSKFTPVNGLVLGMIVLMSMLVISSIVSIVKKKRGTG